MKPFLQDYKEEHLFTDVNKQLWWGDGEWISEPDFVTFVSSGLKCSVKRMAVPDGQSGQHVFGGYLNGYVELSDGHPWLGKELSVDVDVHGGITFNEENTIGFDCAHLGDFVPSIEKLYKTDEDMKKFREKNINFIKKMEEKSGHNLGHFMKNNYRNLIYVMDQCMYLAAQAKEAMQ